MRTEAVESESRGRPPDLSKIIMVVPSYRIPDLDEQVSRGNRQRVEYEELYRELGAEHVHLLDRNVIPEKIRALEDRFRISLGLGMHALQDATRNGARNLFYMAENPAVVHTILPSPIETTAILHHPLSPKKLQLFRRTPMLDRIDNLIVLSNAEAEAFCDAVPKADGKVSVQHCPIDTDFFTPQQASQQDRPFILSSGVSKRNYAPLIEAIAKLPDVTCHISASTHFDNTKLDINGQNLPENVIDSPAASDLAVRALAANCLFGVVSMKDTTQWAAGCTTATIFEAMGKPVIITRLPGLSEYIIEGKTGLVVEPNNPAQLAEAIDYLWKNPDIALEMGKNARAFAVEKFSIQRWVSEMAHRFRE